MRREGEPESEESQQQQLHHLLQPKLLKFDKSESNNEFSDCGSGRRGTKSVVVGVVETGKTTAGDAATTTTQQWINIWQGWEQWVSHKERNWNYVNGFLVSPGSIRDGCDDMMFVTMREIENLLKEEQHNPS